MYSDTIATVVTLVSLPHNISSHIASQSSTLPRGCTEPYEGACMIHSKHRESKHTSTSKTSKAHQARREPNPHINWLLSDNMQTTHMYDECDYVVLHIPFQNLLCGSMADRPHQSHPIDMLGTDQKSASILEVMKSSFLCGLSPFIWQRMHHRKVLVRFLLSSIQDSMRRFLLLVSWSPHSHGLLVLLFI